MPASRFLVEKFHEYYSKRFISGPPQTQRREFGAGFEPGRKISQRHIAFSSESEFNDFLQKEVPFYISYSSAYYELPASRPMEAKKMSGSDLIYEFDADDIKTECKESHDSWKCRDCDAEGKGSPEKCTKCGSMVNVKEWVCPECLGAAKEQTLKLLKFLEDDFSFDPKEISINYSGSKGFHVHVRSEEVRGLSAKARIELFDYLTATELDAKSIGFFLEEKMLRCPLPDSSGWAKRVLETLAGYISTASEEEFSAITGMPLSKAQELLKQRGTILSSMEKGVLFPFSARKSEGQWGKLVENSIRANRLDLDRQTSIDINKIIRVPSTLHGSTGLVARIIPRDSFKEFDALKQCIVFGQSQIKIKIDFPTPKFYIGGDWFGPYQKEETVSVPEYCAVYLCARGDANLPAEKLNECEKGAPE